MRELLEQHRLAAPPNATHLVASVSRATADVLQLALAKTPQERFQTARFFMDALERAMAPLTQRYPARNRMMVSGEDSISGGQSITQAASYAGDREETLHTGYTASTASTAVSGSTSPPTFSSTQPPPRPPPLARIRGRRTGVLWYAAAGVALGAVALAALAYARGVTLTELMGPEADGALEVVAESGAAPATVLVDGVPQGDTPLHLNLSPGPHRVRLLRPGDAEVEREVIIPSRQTVQMTVAPSSR
jgi:hypothetical protein